MRWWGGGRRGGGVLECEVRSGGVEGGEEVC